MYDDNNKYNKPNISSQIYERKTNDLSSSKKSIQNNLEMNNAIIKKGIHSRKSSGNLNKITVLQISENKARISTNATPENSAFNSPFVTKDPKPLVSILKKGGQTIQLRDLSQKRLDSNGILILKGGKKHKIEFKKKMNEVQMVENWKEYNMENYTQTSCHCNIF